jgi:hypothetical protein
MDSKSFHDYQLVKQSMDEMRGIFDEYLKRIEAVNQDIEDGINNGADSALDSPGVGKKFKAQWEALYTDFKTLELFFADVYAKVGMVTTSNAEYEEVAAELFGDSGQANTTDIAQSTILDGADSQSSGVGGGVGNHASGAYSQTSRASYSTR